MKDRPSETLPAAILFACTYNAVRSPMAAAIMRHLHGTLIRVESVGVRPGAPDLLAAAAMEEIGIGLGPHGPRRFEDLESGAFDLVIALSPEAHQKAAMLAPARIEYWPTVDPTQTEGSREQRLAGYRAVRDTLKRRLAWRFPRRPVPDI